ncbi:MAG TPA: undecaprenyldiphospho-muramoylpentapeptide beta-N-acetylglucosaminyltransferase [Bryobacteraceae bacterium]|jgi:UDP-N-acetylglucosamine--N-acetylmuramyl-(pentapeptide) pyrophosphoryl-undecaprenol N-acetylglucosamine transferase|nr:undecaprenyldiphospho-muramoylpentapeptide beta-N-acetylglucosaminyltransferase [Bryobacteraceae bacterium]
MQHNFVLTGGGTGGHVFPAIAVARVLRDRGHRAMFIGTQTGIESRLVPEAGFEMEYIRIGQLNRVGIVRKLQTAGELPISIATARRILRKHLPAAVFSMGGFVAGPVMIAALLRRVPLIVMEPNATPGLANRRVAPYVYRALLGFEQAKRCFPREKSEVTGLPVRPEFFQVPRKIGGPFTTLITGGSRGSRTLNRASRESWPLFRERGGDIRILHQTGTAEHQELAREFAASGLNGEVVPFIHDMAGALARADLVIARSGAGSVNEIAAAGMASVLIPFPFAADDHQKKNAGALRDAGAARMVLDQEMTGERLFREVSELQQNEDELQRMRELVKRFAHPGAAERAADVLEAAATRGGVEN